MGEDAALGEPVVEVAGEALRGAAAWREDERGPVRRHPLGDLLEQRVPHGVARRRQEIGDGGDDLELHRPREAGVHDRAAPPGADEEGEGVLHRADRRRAADPLQTLPREGRQPLERERQMRAPLRGEERVDLVDDDEPRAREGGAESLRREQKVEGLGRRDQHVRGPARHRLARRGLRVARAHGHPQAGQPVAGGGRGGGDAGERLAQVLLDVVVQGPERRDVDDVDALLEAALERQAVQVVEGPEEGRQRLAGSRRRDDQRVSTGRDRRPSLALGARRRPERLLEPAADEGQKRRERHGALIVRLRTRPGGCRRPLARLQCATPACAPSRRARTRIWSPASGLA